MSQCVLVCDDEAHVLQVLRTFLERAGFVVVTAGNGQDGLQAFEQHKPAAVISDFEMPLMNGRELLEKIIEQPESRPQAMFLVTSRTDIELRRWISDTKIVQFLEKPASPRRIVQALVAALNPSRESAA